MDNAFLYCAISLIISSFNSKLDSVTTYELGSVQCDVVDNVYSYSITLDSNPYEVTYVMNNNNFVIGKLVILDVTTGKSVQHHINKTNGYYRVYDEGSNYIDYVPTTNEQMLSVHVVGYKQTKVHNIIVDLTRDPVTDLKTGTVTSITTKVTNIDPTDTHMLLLLFILAGVIDVTRIALSGITTCTINHTSIILFTDNQHQVVVIDTLDDSRLAGKLHMINTDFDQEYFYRYIEPNQMFIQEYTTCSIGSNRVMKRKYTCIYEQDTNCIKLKNTKEVYKIGVDDNMVTYTKLRKSKR